MWRRTAHSEVRHACISDGPARLQHYWDVAVFGWGGIVPLNAYYHPQLFHYRPGDAAPAHIALAMPHEGLGNEDDPRYRLAIHRAAAAEQSMVMFTIYGYEEITAENGQHARDTAILGLRPIVAPSSSAQMPRRIARVVNIAPEEAQKGIGRIPPRSGAAYDQQRQLVFAPRDRTETVKNRELLQILTLDLDDWEFRDRRHVQISEGAPTRHEMTVVDVSSEFGLAIVGATTPWLSKTKRGVLYLVDYRVPSEHPQVTHSTLLTASKTLHDKNGDDAQRTVEPTAAAFVSHEGRVYMLVSGGEDFTQSNREFSAGIYLFDLGRQGGPYRLSRPLLRIPAGNVGINELEIVGEQIVTSGRGLRFYDLRTFLRDALAGRPVTPHQIIPLPYDTHGFDAATIDGQSTLVVASGRNGFEILQRSGPTTPQKDSGQPHADRKLPGQTLSQVHANRMGHEMHWGATTGAKWRHLGTPVMNRHGHAALWAVTHDHREVILHGPPSGELAEAFSTGDKIVTLGKPSINDKGEIAFWVGTGDGNEAIAITRSAERARVYRGSQRFVANVKLSNAGDIATVQSTWSELPHRSLAVLSFPEDQSRPKVHEIFREQAEQNLGTGVYGNCVDDWDMSRDGALGFIVQHGKYAPRVHIWSHTSGEDWSEQLVVRDIGQHAQRPRFSVDGKQLTLRAWKDEIISQSIIDLSDADVRVLAHRRASYLGDSTNPGEFPYSLADNQDNVYFVVVENSQSGDGEKILGNQLWRYARAKASQGGTVERVEAILQPGDPLGDARLLHVRFDGGLNGNGTGSATVDLRTQSGKITQRQLIWKSPN